MRRRTYLAGVGALVAPAIAGCGDGSSASESTSTTPLPPDTVRCALVDYAFRPGTDDPLTIDTGTTVRFVWRTGGHNVVPTEQPAGSDWTGEPDILPRGHTYEYEFTVPGRYHIVCEPHVNLGMVGDIVVADSGTTES
ncbi:plastocyanin/azurin family copper-binding protein [Halarchaeum salinum]|uniref:plastocyanin/azurin family copper-binding protein n=1 Tax=Halarchaeum salinum TaxID=489912 RepID=UPI001B866AB4